MDRYAVWISKNLLLISLVGIAAFSFNLFIFRDESILLYDYKRIFSCFIVILSCISILLSSSVRSGISNRLLSLDNNTLVCISTLLLFAVYANATGIYVVRGFTDLAYYLGLLLFCINTANYKRPKSTFSLLIIITYLCYLSVLVGFIVSILYGDGKSKWTILSYANPRFMNQVQVWLIVPCLYMALKLKGIKYWIPFLLNFSLIFALDARGLFIASVCGIILWAILDHKYRRKILKSLVIAALVGYAIKWITLEPFPAFLITGEFAQSGLSIRTSDSGRLALWEFAITNLSFFGYGGDAFACNSPANARPHNSVILVAFNWGIVSAICYLTLILTLFYSVIKTTSTTSRMWGISLLSGIAYSLISGVLDSPLSQLLGVITLSIYWQSTKKSKTKPSSYNSFLTVMMVATSLLVIVTTSTRVTDRIKNNHYTSQEYWPDKYFPQFWFGNNCQDIEKIIN